MKQSIIDKMSDHALSSTYLGTLAEINALHEDFGPHLEKEEDLDVREMIRGKIDRLQTDLLLIVIELTIRGISISELTKRDALIDL